MTISKSASAERVQHQEQKKKAGKPTAAEKPRPVKMSLEDLGAAILARTQELETRMEPHRVHPDG
jgi:hypothetical protein